MDLAVGLVILGLALVSGRGHNYDASIGELFDLSANRIVRICVDGVRSEA
jgi:hypothetical protein